MPRIGDLVLEDRVHGSLYTDPRIHALELEKIWFRTWVYVGHESEIPKPNDYVMKSIGPEPILMVRGRDGSVAQKRRSPGASALRSTRGPDRYWSFATRSSERPARR